MGLIPILEDTPPPVSNNPLIYYQKTYVGNTVGGGAWIDLESELNKVWQIHHIHIRINDGSTGTYTVIVTDTLSGNDGTIYFTWHNVGNPKQVDLDLVEAAIFKKRLRFWIGTGAGGDPFTFTVIGYTQAI